jgi:multidrug efflux system membrane fusion protein
MSSKMAEVAAKSGINPGLRFSGSLQAARRPGNLICREFPATVLLRIRAGLAASVFLTQIACNSASNVGKAPAGRGGFPASPVTAAKAERKDVPLQVRQIGSVEPVSVIAVKAQIGGELTKVLFREGEDVRKGQQLFEIDPRPYQQAIDQAQAAIEKDNALIAQAQANLARDTVQTANAKEQAQRYDALAKDGLISKDQNSTYQTTYNSQNETLRADEAAINSAKASLNVDKAALETAKLNLSYCSIFSPIDGRAGSLLVQAGNLVKANDTTALVNINQLQPMYVTFSVPEQLLGEIRGYSKDRPLAVTAIVSPEVSVTGQLTFIDNLVDNSTGTIKLKAQFGNADHSLWPGQFINVVMTLRTLRGAIVIPSEAIQSGQQGQFVYVLKADQTVEPRVVKPGQTIGNQIVVESGVSPGETVITDGQMRLIPGTRVQVVPGVNAQSAEKGAS